MSRRYKQQTFFSEKPIQELEMQESSRKRKKKGEEVDGKSDSGPSERMKQLETCVMNAITSLNPSPEVLAVFSQGKFLEEPISFEPQDEFTSIKTNPPLEKLLASVYIYGADYRKLIFTFLHLFIEPAPFLLSIFWSYIKNPSIGEICKIVMKEWTEKRPFDFPGKMFSLVKKTFISVEDEHKLFVRELKNQITKSEQIGYFPITIFVEHFMFISPVGDPSKWILTEVPAQELSRQLSIFFFEQYLKFIRNDFPLFIYQRGKIKKLELEDSLKRISNFVCYSATTQESICFWIEVSNFCYNMGNLFCSFAIVTALKNLKKQQNMKTKSKEHKKMLKTLISSFDHLTLVLIKNSRWKIFFQKNPIPIIPPLSVLLAIGAKVVDSKANWYQKLVAMHKFLVIFYEKAQQNYYYTSHQKIQNLIKSII